MKASFKVHQWLFYPAILLDAHSQSISSVLFRIFGARFLKIFLMNGMFEKSANNRFIWILPVCLDYVLNIPDEI